MSLKAVASDVGNTGTVTTVSVVTAHGISGTVANPTTTPAITLTVGNITPGTVVASGIITASAGITIASGQVLKLGNAFAADTVIATGYITVQDSTGTLYDIAVRPHS